MYKLIFRNDNFLVVSKAAGVSFHRRAEKYYLAIAAKKPRKKQGLIVGDMAKSRRGGWKLTATKTNPAVTQFFSKSMAPAYACSS